MRMIHRFHFLNSKTRARETEKKENEKGKKKRKCHLGKALPPRPRPRFFNDQFRRRRPSLVFLHLKFRHFKAAQEILIGGVLFRAGGGGISGGIGVGVGRVDPLPGLGSV